jgi:hypothetical protein
MGYLWPLLLGTSPRWKKASILGFLNPKRFRTWTEIEQVNWSCNIMYSVRTCKFFSVEKSKDVKCLYLPYNSLCVLRNENNDIKRINMKCDRSPSCSSVGRLCHRLDL